MESRPKNPEFRINPENFHPCIISIHTVLPEPLLSANWKVYILT